MNDLAGMFGYVKVVTSCGKAYQGDDILALVRQGFEHTGSCERCTSLYLAIWKVSREH